MSAIGPEGRTPRRYCQIELMQRLLNPVPYRYRDETSTVFDQIAETITQSNPSLDQESGCNKIYWALVSIIGSVQTARPSVVVELARQADALHNGKQARFAAPQVLFSERRDTKEDSERAALEMRIAAWLYLEHRIGSAKRRDDEEATRMYNELGQAAADALNDLGDEESLALADQIGKRIKGE